jgi:hypothetical protein
MQSVGVLDIMQCADCTEPPGSPSSTCSGYILPPGGSAVVTGKETGLRGFASPAGPGACGRPCGRHQGAILHTIPLALRFPSGTSPRGTSSSTASPPAIRGPACATGGTRLNSCTSRLTNRRRSSERQRGVQREGRIYQMTALERGCSRAGGDTLTETRRRSQDINHRNRRSTCRKDC